MEEILLFNKFFSRLSMHGIVAKIDHFSFFDLLIAVSPTVSVCHYNLIPAYSRKGIRPVKMGDGGGGR